MTTPRRMTALLGPHGFTYDPRERAFITMRREHPADGRRQVLRFIIWGNTRHAERQGIARRHLVIAPGLNENVNGGEDTRLVTPLVQWPSATQPTRPWDEVGAEITGKILPLLDAPEPEGRAGLEALIARATPPRYI